MRAVTRILAIALVVVVGLYLTDPAGAWAVDLIRQASALFGVTILLAKLNFATFGFWAILILAAALLLMIAIKNEREGSLEGQILQLNRDHASKVSELTISRDTHSREASQLKTEMSNLTAQLKKAKDELVTEQQKNAVKPAPKLSDVEASLKYLDTHTASLNVAISTLENNSDDDDSELDDWRIRLERLKATLAGLKSRIVAYASHKATSEAMTEIEQFMAHVEHEAGSVEADALRQRMAQVTSRIETLSKNLDHTKPKLVAS